ncbi:hypothetical protein [Mycobacterium riyadhense]|uniref:hypothetical protein n=1 Tax=Mycobacterium riyadhense TaxID=486698 RepID=UPI00194E2455|nr:hypothetical protein [Mycobacterium riyadhense]
MSCRKIIFPAQFWDRADTEQENRMTVNNEMPAWPPDAAELTGYERRMIDDLRWCTARLDALPDSPEVREMRAELMLLLSDWTADPHTYSNGSPVTLTIAPQRHLYGPPHRREEPQ